MIGIKKWNDTSTYYSQENNATESVMARLLGKDKYLETCGPTSATMIVDAIGKSVNVSVPGKYKMQPEDALFLWFHDRRNYEKMARIRPETDPGTTKYWGNQIPQYYPVAIKEVFGVNAEFRWGIHENTIVSALQDSQGVLVCLKEPGHFVAVVAYNEGTGEIIYNDPWPGNYWPSELVGTSGFNRKMKSERFISNCQPFHVSIG